MMDRRLVLFVVLFVMIVSAKETITGTKNLADTHVGKQVKEEASVYQGIGLDADAALLAKIQVELETHVPEDLFETDKRIGNPYLKGAVECTFSAKPEKRDEEYHFDLLFAERQELYTKTRTGNDRDERQEIGTFSFSYFGEPIQDNFTMVGHVSTDEWFGLTSNVEKVFEADLSEYLRHATQHATSDNQFDLTKPQMSFDSEAIRDISAVCHYKSRETLAEAGKLGLEDNAPFWMKRYSPPPEFKNDEFVNRLEMFKQDEDAAVDDFKERFAEVADKYHFLLAPGFMTGLYPGYFSDNIRILEELGFECTESQLSTMDSVARSTEILYQEVNKIGKEGNKKVIILGHSKGAMDAISAILTEKRESRNADVRHDTRDTESFNGHLVGLISMQGPILGTAISSLLSEFGGALEYLARQFMNCFGSEQAIDDMSIADRWKLWKDNNGWDRPFQDNEKMKFLSMFSSRDFDHEDTPKISAGMLGMVSKFIRKNTGFFNDGMVIPEQALMTPENRHSVAIYFDNMDHAEPANKLPFEHFKPAEITYATLYVYFDSFEPEHNAGLLEVIEE